MSFLIVLVLILIVYGVVEYRLHLNNLNSIPIRIQVNGTRGKSSVTRLIAAGLRAGGLRVVAKVTGTKPRFIVGDKEEYPVRRLGKANIIEEMRIVRLARKYQAQALVIECMALVPEYQFIENRMLIRPTHGVITNVRADHLDVMGPTVMDVARALSNTVPVRGSFFTAERGAPLKILKQKINSAVSLTVTDPGNVGDGDMAGFTYVEHKENVALALAVCESLGVDRKTALTGMYRSLPDSGVMRIFRILDRGKELELVNTLAANDPDSIAILWAMVNQRSDYRVVLVNCRRDRPDRSRQLAELVARWNFDWGVITGGLTRVFLNRALQVGVPSERLVDLGEEIDPAIVYERVWGLAQKRTLIFATGNTVGYGEKLINYFIGRGGGGDS